MTFVLHVEGMQFGVKGTDKILRFSSGPLPTLVVELEQDSLL